MSDSDFVACLKTTKSTSGGMACLGTHVICSWSRTQAVTALSSGEAEYYALVKAASESIGIKRMMQDFGHRREDTVEIKTDASAAIGIANRIGIGKVRHIEVCQLWLQDKVRRGDIKIVKLEHMRIWQTL